MEVHYESVNGGNFDIFKKLVQDNNKYFNIYILPVMIVIYGSKTSPYFRTLFITCFYSAGFSVSNRLDK